MQNEEKKSLLSLSFLDHFSPSITNFTSTRPQFSYTDKKVLRSESSEGGSRRIRVRAKRRTKRRGLIFCLQILEIWSTTVKGLLATGLIIMMMICYEKKFDVILLSLFKCSHQRTCANPIFFFVISEGLDVARKRRRRRRVDEPK